MSPAMTSTPRPLTGLAVGDYATAVLARVEQDEHDKARGLRTLRWTVSPSGDDIVLLIVRVHPE